MVTAATGKFADGPLRLRTVFSFNIEGNGLQCVSYGVSSHTDDDTFKAALIRRYGQPQATRTVPFIGMPELDWKTGDDSITASFSKDDPTYAMHCKKDQGRSHPRFPKITPDVVADVDPLRTCGAEPRA
jgi:hypothetical protein